MYRQPTSCTGSQHHVQAVNIMYRQLTSCTGSQHQVHCTGNQYHCTCSQYHSTCSQHNMQETNIMYIVQVASIVYRQPTSCTLCTCSQHHAQAANIMCTASQHHLHFILYIVHCTGSQYHIVQGASINYTQSSVMLMSFYRYNHVNIWLQISSMLILVCR